MLLGLRGAAQRAYWSLSNREKEGKRELDSNREKTAYRMKRREKLELTIGKVKKSL